MRPDSDGKKGNEYFTGKECRAALQVTPAFIELIRSPSPIEHGRGKVMCLIVYQQPAGRILCYLHAATIRPIRGHYAVNWTYKCPC